MSRLQQTPVITSYYLKNIVCFHTYITRCEECPTINILSDIYTTAMSQPTATNNLYQPLADTVEYCLSPEFLSSCESTSGKAAFQSCDVCKDSLCTQEGPRITTCGCHGWHAKCFAHVIRTRSTPVPMDNPSYVLAVIPAYLACPRCGLVFGWNDLK